MVAPNTLQILVVDSHPTSRAALIAVIEACADMRVCGEAADSSQALKLIERNHPDLVVADIPESLAAGSRFVETVRGLVKDARVLLWPSIGGPMYAERAFQVGAAGCVAKTETTEEIVKAIRAIRNGERFFFVSRPGSCLPCASEAPGVLLVETLSDRELQVFQSLGSGLTTLAIARQLNLSAKTIETFRARICKKLGLNGHVELVRCACEWVLLTVTEN